MRHYDFVSGDHISVQGWTTAEAIAIEKDTLDHERQGRGLATPMLAAVTAHAVAKEAGEQVNDWQPGHEKALFGLLTSNDRMVAIDAPLGSASARHVVGTYLNTAADHGFDVRLMTPSASGATAMTSLMGTPAKTVAAHLWAKKREAKEDQRGWLDRYLNPKHGEVWLVGDAARLRPSGMRDLLKAAAYHDARVVLMDQSHEGKTFGARSFEQLRDAGMMTFQLPEHQGAARDDMRLAVAAFAKNEPALAFDYIRKAGGQIIAIAANSRTIPDVVAAMHERRQWIADRYADLTLEERAKTRVFELTHRGKETLNNAIRKELLGKGDLTGPVVKTEVLLSKSLTETGRKQALSYEQDDIVRFGRSHRRSDQPEIASGEYLRVHQVQAEDGKVILEKDDGRQVTWEPGHWGADNSATYRAAERELAVGERIVWTRTDRALGTTNQQRETIISVEPERGSISVERDNKVVAIDLAKAKHIEHAYAELVHAHLIPAERVIAHVPADNAELANLQALANITLQSGNNDLTIVTENPERLRQVAEDRAGRTPAALDGTTGASGAGFDAVRTAADILAERNAIFSDKDLRELAVKQGLGAVRRDDLDKAIQTFEDRGELVRRTAKIYEPESHKLVPGPGWTTLDAIGDEEKMLAAERRGRGVHAAERIL
ncbi:MAG: AAA family ATPase, partial [Alphaproteobacteria bacterium]|nr:AAA family ATPase [Alphaproteobacteria bacterium]